MRGRTRSVFIEGLAVPRSASRLPDVAHRAMVGALELCSDLTQVKDVQKENG